MKFGEFAEAYESIGLAGGYDANPERRELLADSDNRAAVFSETLQALFEGDPIPEAVVAARSLNYMHWASRDFFPRERAFLGSVTVEDATDEVELDRTLSLWSNLNFHLMNAAAMPLWQNVTARRGADRSMVSAVQNLLSTTALNSLEEIHNKYRNGTFFVRQDPSNKDAWRVNPVLKQVQGTINELDTYVTALEITKKYPEVLILPAPGKFEHSSSRALNSDLLAIDVERQMVRGIQTKQSITTHDAESYDKKYITLIDGQRDLDNIRSVRLPASTKTMIVSWPGLISAHHLLAQKQAFRMGANKGKGVAITPAHSQVQRSRMLARELTAGTHSSLDRAAKLVTDRVLHDLYA